MPSVWGRTLGDTRLVEQTNKILRESSARFQGNAKMTRPRPFVGNKANGNASHKLMFKHVRKVVQCQFIIPYLS